MRKPIEDPIWYAYPGLVAIVTSKYKGEQNIMSVGWHTFMGTNPHTYGISLDTTTHTYDLVKNSGVFGVQFLPAHLTKLITDVGTTSGSDVDKFNEYNILYDDGLKTGVPILKDAYFAYECEVKTMTGVAGSEWVVGEIVQRYQDTDLFIDKGMPDFSKLEVPLYTGRSNYRVLNENAPQKNHPSILDNY